MMPYASKPPLVTTIGPGLSTFPPVDARSAAALRRGVDRLLERGLKMPCGIVHEETLWVLQPAFGELVLTAHATPKDPDPTKLIALDPAEADLAAVRRRHPDIPDLVLARLAEALGGIHHEEVPQGVMPVATGLLVGAFAVHERLYMLELWPFDSLLAAPGRPLREVIKQLDTNPEMLDGGADRQPLDRAWEYRRDIAYRLPQALRRDPERKALERAFSAALTALVDAVMTRRRHEFEALRLRIATNGIIHTSDQGNGDHP